VRGFQNGGHLTAHIGRHIGLHDNGCVNNVCLCDTVDQVNILIKKAIRPCFLYNWRPCLILECLKYLYRH